MKSSISADGLMDVVDDLPVWVVGNLGHFENSSSKFVLIAGLFLSVAEFVESHPSAVIRRADLNFESGHDIPAFDEIPKQRSRGSHLSRLPEFVHSRERDLSQQAGRTTSRTKDETERHSSTTQALGMQPEAR